MNTYKFLQEEGVIHSCTVAAVVFFLCSRYYIVTLLVALFVYKTVCRLDTTDCCCASARWPTANMAPLHIAALCHFTLYTRSRRTGSNYICCGIINKMKHLRVWPTDRLNYVLFWLLNSHYTSHNAQYTRRLIKSVENFSSRPSYGRYQIVGFS